MKVRSFGGDAIPHRAAQASTVTLRRLAPRPSSHAPRCTPHAPRRRGVILLVVMVLLAMFTMLGLTLVMVTAQGRLSALAAARATVESEHSEQMLDIVLTQVVAGSADPNSAIGAHSLLEDKYGLPQFFGQIYQVPAGLPLPVVPLGTVQQNFATSPAQSGTLMQFTVSATQIPNPSVNPAPPGQYIHPLPQYGGAFCGQEITMLTGNAAGHTARVVGYYYDNVFGAGTWAYLQTTSFDGIVPQVGDNFMINGRPFSGTGFGLDLTKFETPGTGLPWIAPYMQPQYNPPVSPTPIRGPLLTGVEVFGNTPSGMPYAYLPNHSRIGVSNFLLPLPGIYWDVAGPGGANEPYDAPDFQNMMLAMHMWGGSGVVTPIPSLHRPELIGWFTQQAQATGNPSISLGNPAGGQAMLNMRRKVILRPEPTDNFFVDSNLNGVWDAREPWYDFDGNGVYTPAVDPFLDLNGNNTYDAGETDYTGKTFNPVTGCWYIAQNGAWTFDSTVAGGLDVDNDQDGVPDSIWVDVGLQPQKESDGNYYKYLAAILCIDLDGKLNLNASGSLAQLDAIRYGTSSSLSGPFTGGLGTTLVYTGSQRTLPAGQGYGPADINPIEVFQRAQGNLLNAERFYQIFLQGYNNPGANQPAGSPPLPPFLVSGRYGEVTRLSAPGSTYPGVYPAYSFPLALGPPAGLSYTQQLFNGPRPGWSQWYDPFLTGLLGMTSVNGAGQPTPFYWANDPVALARLSDYRPHLLVPNSPLNSTTPFFFDFLVSGTLNHLPTAHGTPSDLHSRGFLARDLSGRPYYAGTGTFPWETASPIWMSTMQDFAINLYTSTYPWLAGESVLNEVVDSPYELNLTQNAAREGRNTGNSLNNVAGNDFSTIDDPLRPSELEAILRSHEQQVTGPASTAGLGQRLIDQQTALEYANYIYSGGTAAPLPATKTPLGNDNVRLAVTTESWDAPVPNMALTPQQYQDITAYADFYALPLLNVNNLSIVDLARARIFVENYNGGAPVNPNFPYLNTNTLPSFADLALFGNLKNIQQNVLVFPTLSTPTAPLAAKPNWPLISSDLILGMRLDLNRLLGNGQDDNGNGVVDEPLEALTGEMMTYPMGNPPNSATGQGPRPVNLVTGMDVVAEWLDLNNDGFLSLATVPTDPQSGNPNVLPALQLDPTYADMRARQLLARHLYVTMMLLLDDRSIPAGANPATIAAQIFNTTTTATLPLPWPQYNKLTPRNQAAYIIAQWAINVVDFRDRDSIMTPFEFDLYPFHADDPTNMMATWNVDDVIGINAYGTSDDAAGYRGLVWGCERPELLLTETIAVHDRGTADTNQGQVLNNQTNPPDTYLNQGGPPQDNDYDQVRRPRGSLIVELLNATNQSDAPQYDLQYEATLGTTAQGNQPWQKVDGNGNMGQGINLAQVATGTPLQPWQVAGAAAAPASSPVWRLVIAYSPWLNESAFYTNSPGTYGMNPTTALDSRVPAISPTYIHRVVYFTPYQPSFVTPTTFVMGQVAATSMVNDVLLSRSFFADPDVFPGFMNSAGANPAVLMVPPGQYALVAPASPDSFGVDTLYLGKNLLGPGTAVTNLNSANLNVQALQLGNQFGSANPNATVAFNTIAMYKTAAGGIGPYGLGYSQVPTVPSATVKQVIGVPIQTNWFQNNGGAVYTPHSTQSGLPANTVTIASTLRMSLSEPERGYPLWPAGTGSRLDDDVYYSQIGSPKPGIPNFPQHPFDSGQNNPLGGSYSPFGDLPNSYVAPSSTTTAETPGTTVGYTMLYLQRLANPLAAWDPNANPYLTVDSMPVDLTTYTGESNGVGSTWVSGGQQKGEPTTTPAGNPVYINGVSSAFARLDSRRRGYDPTNLALTLQTSQPGIANIWTPPWPASSLTQPAQNQGGVITSGTIAAPLSTATLGYLNSEYGGYWTSTNLTQVQVGATGIPVTQYYGEPMMPIPWITWNNRPYVSQYELMLVPTSNAASLYSDFGMIGWPSSLSGKSALNEYSPEALAQTLKPPVAQFEHLLNFFENQAGGPTGSHLPNMYRIFEFLHVPSRFAGTQDMLNPTMFLGDNAVPFGSAGITASHLFHPPFNWMSRYREPGKINLNTTFNSLVFQSLVDDYPGANTVLWPQVRISRYGQPQTGQLNPSLPNPLTLWGANATGQATLPVYPTYFANPFRPDGAGMLVPPTSVGNPLQSAMLHAWNYPASGGIDNGVNATLLRSAGMGSFPTTNPAMIPSPPTLGPLALFDDTNFDSNNFGVTYGSISALNPAATAKNTFTNTTLYRHAGEDPAFQYQMFERLGNTTTNRSNVYAIWITLGKFQVQPIGVNPTTNPDGYRLLQPANDVNGNPIVQRGFYIFDRSIPMGFQRGQNTNIEKGLLLERVLQ